MDDVQKLAGVLAVVACFSIVMGTFAIAWRYARRRIDAPPPRPAGTTSIDDARLTRLEQAVDTIAIEVERIAESQRFAVKLMSERQPEALRAPSDER